MKDTIAVLGLGYVGLPVALAFSRAGFKVIGYDVNQSRVAALQAGYDWTGEACKDELRESKLHLTAAAAEMTAASFLIVTVPTPIDGERRPDLSAIISASETVGRIIRCGSVVVLESTVYPGVTEEVCGPAIARVSGLVQGVDFKMGYSPERINPGDREHRLDSVIKVVSGEDAGTLERVASMYAAIVPAGIHRAPSIRVAEAAKVIENTQRDLNIALMNELAIIFHRLGIDTLEVLQAAGTKWNFLPFRPGLVGGHCIGVDPYYLTHKAEKVGYHPQVILAGRRINDGMGKYVAEQTVKHMIQAGFPVRGQDVIVLGLTFKENCPDIRNTRVIDVVRELESYGALVHVHDPIASGPEAEHEYGVRLSAWEQLPRAAAIVVAVAHREFVAKPLDEYAAKLAPGGVLVDVKCML